MTKDEALKLALEALEEVVKWYQARDKDDKPMPPHNQNPEIKQAIETINVIKEALAQPEPVAWEQFYPDIGKPKFVAQPEQEPVAYIRLSKTGNVMACAKTGDFYKLPDKTLLYTSPQPAPVQEPVAWHKGDSVYWHTSPDLNDWIRANGEPLYTNPPPCPTCEALARTVMLDQTSHDAQRKPLTDEEVEKIIKSNMSLQMNLAGIRADIEAAHNIKELV